MAIFGSEYAKLGEEGQKRMKKRARAMMRKKYRETWNKKMTRSCLQQVFTFILKISQKLFHAREAT